MTKRPHLDYLDWLRNLKCGAPVRVIPAASLQEEPFNAQVTTTDGDKIYVGQLCFSARSGKELNGFRDPMVRAQIEPRDG